MFTALLDTCVLWPSLQRDLLLSLAIEGVYRPIWSTAILEELEYHEAKKLVRRGADEAAAEERAHRLVETMRLKFDDAVVTGWERLDGSYGLPDPDDEHVVAAAELGGAGAIVTLNFKDFPDDKIPSGIDILGPASFVHDQVSLRPAAAARAVLELASRTGQHGPKLSPTQIVDVLESRYEMQEAAALLRHQLADPS
ncbi:MULTISPECIES: PIN domain-containing protein [Curtobacterium]|uniref:PIN domain-containing protein n=1 Tax=Curtobacterium TaxID=2034 RepID=UPI001564B4DB|nr:MULTISPECIES: PIN domain-containing protein [Curtobacterium]NQX23220.1 PIN domain-containing protein [Curtobacterium sp. VKM Ac-2852]MBT1608350.1 PIN domain-containing protein [Curtobacterium flaccumfaciens pv. betae]MBT1656649.1 PIN domain-containing protein [Curtobacterium flaccumfaciens pv. betae]MCE0456727.1 PIN domain-containing protein [Curtobacterium allii]MCS0470824.1 PIN domain-containing protein [Curtobacterium flaccumfaciens pv. betae]